MGFVFAMQIYFHWLTGSKLDLNTWSFKTEKAVAMETNMSNATHIWFFDA